MAYEEAPSPQILEEGVLYQHACCDCGLVHDETYYVKDGEIHRVWERNNRSTGQYRRHNRITVKEVSLPKENQ